jgi:hypothetical protein
MREWNEFLIAGESREASWNTVQQSRSSRDDAKFLESASNLQQQEQQQQSENVEYYDDEEYYEDEVPTAGLTQEGAREPKVARPDDQLPERANGTVYEDSYYYDDDYEEGQEEAAAAVLPSGTVNGTEIVQHPEVCVSLFFLSKSSRVFDGAWDNSIGVVQCE